MSVSDQCLGLSLYGKREIVWENFREVKNHKLQKTTNRIWQRKLRGKIFDPKLDTSVNVMQGNDSYRVWAVYIAFVMNLLLLMMMIIIIIIMMMMMIIIIIIINITTTSSYILTRILH